MAAPQLKQYQIDNEEELLGKLASKGLKVLEVYFEWAGMCKSVLPLFRKIRLEKEDESALMFLAVSANKCSTIGAVNEHADKSEPLFLLYRNGQLKSKVCGADVPMLSASIYDFTPANADIDDLEENPFFVAKRGDGATKDGMRHADLKHKAAKRK